MLAPLHDSSPTREFGPISNLRFAANVGRFLSAYPPPIEKAALREFFEQLRTHAIPLEAVNIAPTVWLINFNAYTVELQLDSPNAALVTRIMPKKLTPTANGNFAYAVPITNLEDVLENGTQTRQRTDLSGPASLRRWLSGRSPEVLTAIAARAALRVLPRVDHEQTASILAIFRAMALAWTAAKYPILAQQSEFTATVADAINSLRSNQTPPAAVCALAASVVVTDGADVAADTIDTASAAVPSGDLLRAVAADMNWIEVATEQHSPIELFNEPLWLTEIPQWFNEAWDSLRQSLLAKNESWQVWVCWFENRILYPGSATEPRLESILPAFSLEFWQQAPPVVNSEIERLANAAHLAAEPFLTPFPSQGSGPKFAVGTDARIELAPPDNLDVTKDNLERIRHLLPLVRSAADNLAASISRNAFPELTRDLKIYRDALSSESEQISWGLVWGLGVRLEGTVAAVERSIDVRLEPALEDAARSTLRSLLTLHRSLIFSTAEGRELLEQADKLRMTFDQQQALRKETLIVAEKLYNDSELADIQVAETVILAAEEIGIGRPPERGTVFGINTIRNILIILVSAAMMASLIPIGMTLGGGAGGLLAAGAAWPGMELLKRTKIFADVATALGTGFDRVLEIGTGTINQHLRALIPFRRFVITNEQPLRRIAARVGSLRWMTAYIDFVERNSTAENERRQNRLLGTRSKE